MTDLQVKYQLAQETMRANREQERLKEAQLAIDDRKQYLAEQKFPYEAREILSRLDLNAAQIDKIASERDLMLHEISNLDARTDLTNTQKQSEIQKIVNSAINMFGEITGINSARRIVENFLGGLGSAAGKALIRG